MDLSAVIFVVLALAWAVYLIPKALKHHDEMASDRLVEGHSDKVRILSRRNRSTAAAATAPVVESAPDPSSEPTPAPAPVASRRVVTRVAARKAARRRRRVLAVLVLALAVVWTFTWFAYLPIWAPAIPGALAVGWLVLARLSVRRARRAVVRTVSAPAVEHASEHASESGIETRVETRQETDRETGSTAHLLVEQLADEDTAGIDRQDLEAVLADDGSLWDPLPMTLPTYVNKARARRTVRTIELTGINSSGHDQADTDLARDAAESAHEATQAGDDAAAEHRKAAGA